MVATLQSLLNREKVVSSHVPYSSLVDEHIVRTERGAYLTVIRLEGIAHEAARKEDVRAWHDALNGLIKNMQRPDVAIWRHTVRREYNRYPAGEFDPGFAHDLNEKYRALYEKERMMVNDLYFTIVLREPSKAASFFAGKKKNREEIAEEIRESCASLNEIANMALAGLSRYKPERLGCYQHNDVLFSKTLEFLGYLLNNEWSKVAVPRSSIKNILPSARLSFGVESGEVRSATSSKLFAMISWNDYAEDTVTGDLNEFLTVPFEFIITHSYACMDKTKALALIDKQAGALANTNDAAKSQIADLAQAADDLSAGRIGFGEHHFSLLITADNDRQLIDRVSIARDALVESGFSAVREDLALEAAYWAQLPANFVYRPRPAPISSKNFAGLIALHNYPVGQAEGNQWGPAVTVVRTTSGSPFYLNLHLPKKSKKNPGRETDDEKVAGNTLIIGPTGSGKTVDQTFILSQMEKYKPTVFTFDKDRGQEIFVRAMGGQYFVLEMGARTGFNPFQMESTPKNLLFLEDLVKVLARGSRQYTAVEESNIATAVRAAAGHDVQLRGLGLVRQYMDNTDPEGPYARLAKWVDDGPLAWVFDNPRDMMQDLLSTRGLRHYGFDVTEFLDNPTIRTPIIMYLFHQMRSLIGKGRFILNMDEFWKMLEDEYFVGVAKDQVKTIRKQDGLALFGTQGLTDVLNSPIASSLIEQCPTKIFKPNPYAKFDEHVERFGLTEREFEIIKKEMVEDGIRGFLFKQEDRSVVCELNLAGFNDELAILSGTSFSIDLCRKAIERAGPNPAMWMPVFQQYRRGS